MKGRAGAAASRERTIERKADRQDPEGERARRGEPDCADGVAADAPAATATADAEQRVTVLEAQLAAMGERLQTMYATARELISTADLETLLRHIVERAAHTARAPSYILAVRTRPAAELQVYGHGIDDARAADLARTVLEGDEREALEPEARVARGEAGGAEDSMLVVDVRSGRCSYGKLIARYPEGARFSPQERELLNLYAQNAAAALDVATALDESTRRHDQVSSLLGLAQAVSRADASEEIAKRLAAAGRPVTIFCAR